MKKKLTLTIEEHIILRAKEYARNSDRSLSELIESYLHKITALPNLHEPETSYAATSRKHKGFVIPDFLKEIAGSINADIDYVKDREKIREERIAKYL